MNFLDARKKSLLQRSASPDGYVREAAIKDLAPFACDEVLAALLLRANDWVPAIRKLAKAQLLTMLHSSSATYYLNNLTGLYHLQYCARGEHGDFVAQVENQLLEYPEVLLRCLAASKGELTYLIATLLLKSESLDKQRLCESCLQSDSEKVRHFALKLLDSASAAANERLQYLALQDRSSKVRRAALHRLTKAAPQLALLVARQLMFDVHPGVRLTAIYVLKEQGFDCEAAYREKLRQSDKPSDQQRAIWGLLELFVKSSLKDVAAHLNSEYPSVRLQALKACYVFCRESALPELLEKMLVDSSPKVVKEAARMLWKSEIAINLPRYQTIILQQKTFQAYHSLLGATQSINKWQQLIFLSNLSSRAQEPLHEPIRREFKRWHERMPHFFTDPTASEIKTIHGLSACAKQCWSPQMRGLIIQRLPAA